MICDNFNHLSSNMIVLFELLRTLLTNRFMIKNVSTHSTGFRSINHFFYKIKKRLIKKFIKISLFVLNSDSFYKILI